MRAWLRRPKTYAWRLLEALTDARWVVISGALVVLSFLSVSVDFPWWVTATLSGVSLALLVGEAIAYFGVRRERDFPLRSTQTFGEVRKALQGNARFAFFEYQDGEFLLDRLMTANVGNGKARGILAKTRFEVGPQLREVGTAYRRTRVAEDSHLHNGDVLGLATDLGFNKRLLTNTLELVPANYWDHLATDIFATHSVTLRRAPTGTHGRSLYIDRRDRPRDFGSSWLLNALGTQVIAITSDWRVVAIYQSKHNETSRELYAPSGSGSLEPKDFGASREMSIKDLAAAGALREMAEEASIGAESVKESAFLGFGRWLNKAAKPELFSVCFLKIESHEVPFLKIQRADKAYTKGIVASRLSDSSEWDPGHPELMVEGDIRESLSVPLETSLTLLALTLADEKMPAHDVLVRRLAKRD